ncbi:signal peptidase I [Acinetobacter larvae]|uniref:Signal peptidase I n=1 Tax=Acinetobacter larvae TaxID=1789224 RepID=A0A1B2M1Y4_9GAMM|nr:signal peptidase I [Acinetobacter larvae]AOA59033.1 signal peptidase I [Acinetobacter larvae]
MDFDFNLILVPLTLVFFVIWLLDKLVFKQRKTRGKGHENAIITWSYDFWPVMVVVLVLRSFFYEPFNIPSESMVPTLETGDFILVNKYQYGVRLPILNDKIINISEPKRGEVFVFRYPEDPKLNYIKRVIGIPGDHIVYKNGVLSVNGQPVVQEPVAFERSKDSIMEPIAYFKESLGEHQHLIRRNEQFNPLFASYADNLTSKMKQPYVSKTNRPLFLNSQGNEWEAVVKDHEYFAMGDNREYSADSRYWGMVPAENLVGKAVYIWTHKEPGWNLPSFSRNSAIK